MGLLCYDAPSNKHHTETHCASRIEMMNLYFFCSVYVVIDMMIEIRYVIIIVKYVYLDDK